jgi:hypothetical protein
MPEGFTTSDGHAGAAVHDNRKVQPEPDATAPRGWTWNRTAGSWQPKVRGPVIWQGHADQPPEAVQDTGPSAGSTYDRDPEPGWMSDPGPPADDGKFVPTSSDRADIKALIALLYTVPAETLPLIDPYCFGPLGEKKTATGIIDAVTDIVSASPRVAQWAVSTAGLMPWVKLAIALKPLAVNVLHHHITHSVEVEVDRAKREMTVTERDFSMYTAA